MIVDHIWFLFFPDQVIWRIIWRAAFPLFLFLVWYNHSFKWRPSLWIYGILLQLLMWIWSAYWLIDIWYFNILLAIWFTRVIMNIIQKYDSFIGEAILFIVCWWLLRYVHEYVDYGTISIMFALLGYWIRKYGSTIYMSILIAISVCYHLVFMIFTWAYGQNISLMTIVWIILFVAMYLMSKRNYDLQTSSHWFNQYISSISRHALEIYIIQIVILGGIYLISS